ncbi:hypothetical protein D3C87_1939760 [compost metagenome]
MCLASTFSFLFIKSNNANAIVSGSFSINNFSKILTFDLLAPKSSASIIDWILSTNLSSLIWFTCSAVGNFPDKILVFAYFSIPLILFNSFPTTNV